MVKKLSKALKSELKSVDLENTGPLEYAAPLVKFGTADGSP